MPVPFYSLTEHETLAALEMRAWADEEAKDDQQTVDHFVARAQDMKRIVASRHQPKTPQDYAAVVLSSSERMMPYAVATGETLGEIIQQYVRFHLLRVCDSALIGWAEVVYGAGGLSDAERIV